MNRIWRVREMKSRMEGRGEDLSVKIERGRGECGWIKGRGKGRRKRKRGGEGEQLKILRGEDGVPRRTVAVAGGWCASRYVVWWGLNGRGGARIC